VKNNRKQRMRKRSRNTGEPRQPLSAVAVVLTLTATTVVLGSSLGSFASATPNLVRLFA
jgi:hypothetical protein